MTPLATTVRRPRPVPVPGPMPPRWERRLDGAGYSHTEHALTVDPHGNLATLVASSTRSLQSLSTAAADLVDLLAWLQRGGR